MYVVFELSHSFEKSLQHNYNLHFGEALNLNSAFPHSNTGTAHSHMTLQALEISPLPRHMQCRDVDSIGSEPWLRKIRRERYSHTKKGIYEMKTNSKLPASSTSVLDTSSYVYSFRRGYLDLERFLGTTSSLCIPLREFLESQVNDVETKCEVTEIHDFVRSMSMDSFEAFYESMLFCTVLCT